MNRKIIFITVYCVILIIISVMATHNEIPRNKLIITLWFLIPMVLTYCLELYFIHKDSAALYTVVAIANTAVVFAVMAAIGAYLLNRYMNIS